ncbi:hypothetical protein G3O08_17955 [Cryomorpha ignava]|uniref:Uncharacterized protein n=1 Tax=Cryomorpha ignava TaxID=101383 RepID=A0A7K3WV58_9FLAO|nr:hypothetical protein [Cryomorpha ignava]NEN25384.1 hypothetical protein [Cryomorpha ignava]
MSVINGRSGNLLNWRSVTWEKSNDLGDGWERAEILIPLYQLDLRANVKFKIFLWNPEKRNAFVDNLTYTIY